MRRNSDNSHNTVISTPVNTHKTTGLRFSRFSTFSKNSNNNIQPSNKGMTPPILTSINQPVSEIKQNMAKRLSWKVSPKMPKFIRTSSSSSTKSKKSILTLNNDNSFANELTSSNKISSSPTKLSFELPPQNSPNSLRVGWKGNTSDLKKPSNEPQDTSLISENWETITSNDLKLDSVTSDENNEKIGSDHSISFTSSPILSKSGAPLLISNVETMSSSTTKTQKKNAKAANNSKSLPKNFWRFLNKSKPPELVTTPSLSPPSVSQFSYVSPPLTIPKKTKKKRDSRPKSGSFAYTKQTLANVLLRRVRKKSFNETIIDDNGAPVITYTSFPDPDPEDYVNIYTWDLPDSISATEAAGGVLQMIEYDGIYVNGLRVN